MSQLIPSAVSLRIAETEQLYQAQRMIGGIGNVLLRPVLKLKMFVRVQLARYRATKHAVVFLHRDSRCVSR